MGVLLALAPACGARVSPMRDPDAGPGREPDASDEHDVTPLEPLDSGIDSGSPPPDDELSPEEAVCADRPAPAEPPECWVDGAGSNFSDVHPLPEAAVAVAMHGERAYVLFDDARLAVVDISNEASPVLGGTVALPGEPADVQIGGRWAWVAGRSAGLLGVDVLHALEPVLVSQLELPGSATAVHATCTHAFVACGSAGLLIVDITVPAAPEVVGSLALQGDAISISVDGDLVLVGTTEALEVVDASALDQPFVRSTLDEGGPVTSIASGGSWAFVGLETPPGTSVVDLSDLDHPIPTNFLPEYGAVVAMEVGPHVVTWTALGAYQLGVGNWCDPPNLLASTRVVRGGCGPDCEERTWQSVDVAMDGDRGVTVYNDPAFGLQFSTPCCI